MEWNADLEAAVRKNPDDEAAWGVLEDWTLERGGVRARIIERKNAGDEKGALEATWRLEEELFGERRAEFLHRVDTRWRAGYIETLWLKGRSGHVATLEQVLALPCSALIRAVHSDVDDPGELPALLDVLSRTTLRELRVSSFWKPTERVTLEGSLLEPLTIERLHLHGRAMAVAWAPALSRLTALTLTPGAPGDLEGLFTRAAALPALRRLSLHARTLEFRHPAEPGLFDAVFDATATPALERLELHDLSDGLRARVLERLATRPLLSRLEELCFGYQPFDASTAPELHRAAFAHLRR